MGWRARVGAGLVVALVGVGCATSEPEGPRGIEERPTQKVEPEFEEPPQGEGDAARCNDIPAMELSGGLRVAFMRFGDGPSPEAGQQVTVHYTGWLTDGTMFDSSLSRNEPFTFPLGEGKVIRGWDEGVANMKIGSKACLLIPPEMGYGITGAGDTIPPGAHLIFEVELLEAR